MKRALSIAFGIGLAGALPAAIGGDLVCGAGAALASSVRIDYAVTASRSPLSLSGDGVVVYQRRGDAYAMESTVNAMGLFEAQQTSSGTVGPQGLVPRTFTHRAGRRPQVSVGFDWRAQTLTFSQTGSSEPTRPRMQDRLSLLLQLSWLHRADPRAGEIVVPVAGQRRTSDYTFIARGAEALDLPAGRFDAVKFDRRGTDRDDVVEVWLAPELCSLPVRVRFSDDKGLVVDQRLRAVHSPTP